MTLSLEVWPTKAKEAPSPHELRLAQMDTNPVFQYLGENVSSVISVSPVMWRLSFVTLFAKSTIDCVISCGVFLEGTLFIPTCGFTNYFGNSKFPFF